MVTREELENLPLRPDEYYSSKYTTPEEMTRFEKEENDLRYMLMKLLKGYQENHGYKSNTKALEMFAEECRTSETTLKKCMNGTQTISRKLLYKLSVGLKMSLEEANQYFSLCGGNLRCSDPIDRICINAIRDKDDIDLFIKQVLQYTGVKLVNKNSI